MLELTRGFPQRRNIVYVKSETMSIHLTLEISIFPSIFPGSLHFISVSDLVHQIRNIDTYLIAIYRIGDFIPAEKIGPEC